MNSSSATGPVDADQSSKYQRCLALEKETGKNAFGLAAELFQRIYKISPPPEYVFTEKTDGTTKRFTAALTFNETTFVSDDFTNKKAAKLDCARQVTEMLISEDDKDKDDTLAPLVFQHETTFAELLRQHTYALFGRLNQRNPIGVGTEKVVASIFMMDNETAMVDCISFATGNKCIRRKCIGYLGQALIDCHAEILARRGLLRFFYAQIGLFTRDPMNSIFERRPSNEKLTLKPRYSFHIFINTAPCGDSRIYSIDDLDSENLSAGALDRNKGKLRYKIEDGMGTVLGKTETGVQTVDGLQRYRIQSCSDKILRWNVFGLQGALLGHFLEPVYLSTVSISDLFSSRISRAVSQRLDGFVPPENTCFKLNHPTCLSCQTGLVTAPIPGISTQKVSINWNIVDQTLEPVNTENGRLLNGGISRLSCASFFRLFTTTTEKLTNQPLPGDLTYLQAKVSNESYMACKRRLIDFFSIQKLGEWQEKPIEYTMFTLNEISPVVKQEHDNNSS